MCKITTFKQKSCVKVSFCIVQCPVLSIAQSTLHFTPGQTCSIAHHLDFSDNMIVLFAIVFVVIIVLYSSKTYRKIKTT